MLIRRSLSDPPELAYYLSNASAATPLRVLAEVAGARRSTETTIEEGKGEAGLDEYEVRYWHSWHRHITLAMMVHSWLAAMRQVVGGKSAGPGTGRAECARGAALVGDCPTAAPTQPRTAARVAPLVPGSAAASAP